jgi:hypothetical protein
MAGRGVAEESFEKGGFGVIFSKYRDSLDKWRLGSVAFSQYQPEEGKDDTTNCCQLVVDLLFFWGCLCAIR